MKYNLKRIVLVTLCLLAWLPGRALSGYQSFIVNGIGYRILTDNTVAVSNRAQGPQQSIQEIPAYQDIPYAGDIVIPSTVTYGGITYTVTDILGSTFKNNTSITSITIPASVQEIGAAAFWNSGLKKLTITDGSTPLILAHLNYGNYGDRPFGECKIDTLYMGRDIKTVNSEVSYYALFGTSLKEVATSDFVKIINPQIFYNCKSLTKATFGKNIEKIGASAFNGCEALLSANLGDNVTFIGSSAFYGCKALQTVNISDKVKIIQDETFRGCTSLKSVTGFAAVDSIKGNAFRGCSSLAAITIPASVLEIGMAAFLYSGLKKLTIADGSTPLTLVHQKYANFGDRPFGYCEIDTLYLGRDIELVDSYYSYYALFGTSLKEVAIGDMVKTLNPSTFYNCTSLKKATLGKNIEQIGTNAFYGCNALQMITASWETPIETPDDMFGTTVYKNAKLYIPGGTLPVYQATGCWNKFQSILPMQYGVTVDVTAGGSVKVNGGETVTGRTQSYWIDRETEVTFDVAADEDNNLLRLTVNGEDVTAQLVNGRFTVASLEDDINLTAMFVMLPQYAVTASVVTQADGEAGIGGTATLASGTVISGHSTTVRITTFEGYFLKSVTVNGVDKTSDVVDGILTLTDITEDTNVVVMFQKRKLAVMAAECEHGSIGLSATSVEWDGDVTVTVTPDREYALASLSVNGEDVTSAVNGNKYVIRNIKSDVEIRATFSATFVLIELSADGERTYCCDHDLDFSLLFDIRAYIVSGYYPNTGYVLLTRVLEVPAGTGIVVRGDAGIYKVPFGESNAYYSNLLVGNVEPLTIEPTEGAYTNLFLTDGAGGLGFYPVTASFMMEANSARLQLPSNVVGGESCVKIAYEEDADGIEVIHNSQFAIHNDGTIYDLSGRQIANGKNTKGINIIRQSNGTTRKVMVK